MNQVRYTEVSSEEEGQRLDNYLIRLLKGVPKSHIYRLIRSGEVRVNKKRAKPMSRLTTGDIVRIPPVRRSEDKPVRLSSGLKGRLTDSIIYEDEKLLVLNKPSGIAVHGGSGLSLGVIEALRKARTDLPYLELAHRLDKETSGCLVLAKKRSTLRAIQAKLLDREVKKIYWALLDGTWQGNKKILVDQPLLKNTLKSGERVVKVHQEGKPSQTTVCLLENFEEVCLVEASPKTGRTHQIRVHTAILGHPIIGDEKYGQGRFPSNIEKRNERLYLHARSIQFTLDGKKHMFQAELDERFSETLAKYRARSD